MSDRYDAIAFKEGQGGKTYAVRLGSAVPKKNGPGFTLYLDAMPAPKDGQYVITIAPPREREQGASRGPVNGSPRQQATADRSYDRGSSHDPNDDYPF